MLEYFCIYIFAMPGKLCFLRLRKKVKLKFVKPRAGGLPCIVRCYHVYKTKISLVILKYCIVKRLIFDRFKECYSEMTFLKQMLSEVIITTFPNSTFLEVQLYLELAQHQWIQNIFINQRNFYLNDGCEDIKTDITLNLLLIFPLVMDQGRLFAIQ